MNTYKIVGYDVEAIKQLTEVAQALEDFEAIRNSYLAELAQLRNKYQIQLLSCMDTISQIKDLK